MSDNPQKDAEQTVEGETKVIERPLKRPIPDERAPPDTAPRTRTEESK